MKMQYKSVCNLVNVFFTFLLVCGCQSSPEFEQASGDSFTKAGMYADAISRYSKVLDINQHDAMTYNKRGQNYFFIGEYDLAIKDYSKAIEIDPQSIEFYRNRGLAYFYSNSYQQALDDFLFVISKRNEDELANYYTGEIYCSFEDYSNAIKYFEVFTEKNKNANTLNVMGVIYNKLGEYQKAIQVFSDATIIDENNADAYNGRGLAYENTGEYIKAHEDFSKSININQNFDAYYNRAQLSLKKKEYENSLNDLDTIINIEPENAELYHIRGYIYLKIAETITDIEAQQTYLQSAKKDIQKSTMLKGKAPENK